MRQPIPTWEDFDEESRLLAALGIERSTMPVEVYCNGPRHVFVGLESPRAVAALEPDISTLARLGEIGVSCFAGAERSWKTRMFAPGLGVAEDPATGSAAGPLAVHLARHARIAFGMEIEISQGVEIDRPSLLRARVRGADDRIESVEVGGRAVVIGRGELQLP
jgi:trans-2,3-dihydro-3-hydroxyanthranilate isomerase